MPVTVSGVTDAVNVKLGFQFSCARRMNGTVVCWGDNYVGRLGNGTIVDALVPTPVTGLAGVREIYAAADYACAATSTETQCWGWSPYGEFGDGAPAIRLVPDTPVVGLP